MANSKTLILLLCQLLTVVTVSKAEPQLQQGQRPIYGSAANGPPPRPQEQHPTGNYAQGPPINSAYQRQAIAYQQSPRPVSIHQLPSPNPVPSSVQRQQTSVPRQAAPSGIPPRQSVTDVSETYAQPTNTLQSRPRFPLSSQQQTKYSSQLKVNQALQGSKQNQLTSEEAEFEAEQENEPDRLTLLLQESKFSCAGKKDGYYADEGLNCEVFHYCQDGGKHSWMCPNNFAFHQVHLICVPPSSDNICKQSTDYHFVNDYLYRPINEKEAQASNTSLKYADRYYPDGYTPGTPLDEMLSSQDSSQFQHEPRAPAAYKQHHGHGARPSPQGGNRNVFYSPESINIPLSQRRPPSRPAPAAPAKAQHSQQQPSYEEYEEEEY